MGNRKRWHIFYLQLTMTWFSVSSAMLASLSRTKNDLKEAMNGTRENESENLGMSLASMSNMDLVTKVLEMEKLLKNHNGRISSQEKINHKQTDDIIRLQAQMELNKREVGESSGRVKRLVSQKLAETKPSLLPPYPDNPDITNRRGNFLPEPNNCNDLRLIGHYMNGFYFVKSSLRNGEFELVFCNFTRPSQELKEVSGRLPANKLTSTSSVHFFVQRKTILKTDGVVPFDVEKLNVGSAMNLSSGIFTTPKTGIYHFAFSGIRDIGAGHTYVYLHHGVGGKPEKIALAYADKHYNYATLSFTSTIRLKKGDHINLFLEDGNLYDSENELYTSFTGSLLMEEHED